MRLRTFLAGAAVVLAPSAIACSVLTDDTASQTQDHTEDRPTVAQYPWLWTDDTFEEFQANAEATSMWSRPDFFPEDHPMAQRLQFWVDRIDEALRARLPEAMRATPKPHIILRKDSEPNAWVSYIPVTWNVPARITSAEAGAPGAPASSGSPAPSGSSPPPPPPRDPAADGGDGEDGGADGGALDADGGAPEVDAPPFLLQTTGRISILSYGSPLAREHDAKALGQFVKFYNDGFAKCRLSVEGDELVFGGGCAIDPQVSATHAKSIVFYTTSKWVTVTTGLITSMLDEDRIVAVLAHELGHYYRTHSSIPSDLLNYFYALEDGNAAVKPAPDPRYLAQTLAVRDKLREASWFTSFAEENQLMTEQRLGFYTTEQEADEIALESLTRIGMPPTLGPDSMLQLQKILEDMSGGGGGGGGGGEDVGEIGWAKCSDLRERSFRGDDGKEIAVPVGNLTDPHHSFCFRVFNMGRELAAHKYEVGAERPRPPGGEWTKLVTRLSAELEAPPPPAGDAGAPEDAGAPSDAGND